MLRDNISDQAILFALVLVLVLLYIVWCSFAAWRERSFKSNSVINTDEAAVPDASTATNFQLASVYPNATFGAHQFLIIPLLNAFSMLVSNWVTKRFLERLLNVISKHHTPHEYAADAHSMPNLQRFTAFISLSVFVAVTIFEVVFLARIGNYVIGAEPGRYYGLLICIILMLTLATVLGGQKTSLISDRWLLPAAYVGMHLAIANLLLAGKPRDIDLVSALVFLALVFMIFIRVGEARRASGIQSFRHWIIVVSTVALLGSMIFGVAKGQILISHDTFNTIGATFQPSNSRLTWGVFCTAVLAAISPAVFYNFVDFSFWQKYSIELKRFETIQGCVRSAHRPFLLYLVESPLNWLLPVLLGLYAATAIQAFPGADPVGVLFGILMQGRYGNCFALLLFISLTSIATSTATSYLASLGDLWKRDISNIPYDQNHNSFSSGWHYIVFVAIAMLVVLVPIDIVAKTTDQLILLLLTSFSPLCALTPLIVWPIFTGKDVSLKQKGKFGVMLAVIAGSVIGLSLGIVGVFLGVGPDRYLFWLPMPLSFVFAWAIYLFSIFRLSETSDKFK